MAQVAELTARRSRVSGGAAVRLGSSALSGSPSHPLKFLSR
jgi:hypothetical protein